MKSSDKILSQTITQLCLLNGIDHVIISPGSRNAALIIGFTGHPDFKNFSIVDERCAAFFALGIAQQLKKPVALVCTSGSALLNYYPAVAEAFYSDIPLVIISADRPLELVEIGDGQTIRQENVFSHHILYSANCVDGVKEQSNNEKVISEALNVSFSQKGPVHINAPFSEPLYGTCTTPQVKVRGIPPKNVPEDFLEDMSSFSNQWSNSRKKMVLVGVLSPNSIEQRYIDILGKDESVVVLTEATSNLHHENFFPAIDQLIAPMNEQGFKDLQPDILLTIGGMVVSKKIKAFLRNYPPKEHWHVSDKKAYDTFFCLKHHIKTTANNFFKELLPIEFTESTYLTDCQKIKEYRLKSHFNYKDSVVYSDFKVFSQVFSTLPKGINLQLSNSTTIRYAQLFEIDSSVKVFCNRGTSGIDGSTSTAIGAAYASKLQTVFVTGDLSFLYDSNALWNNYIPSNFRLIVINNNGGGIFRILPGAKQADHFDQYFETQHNLTAKPLCEMFNIEYNSAVDFSSLQEQLNTFYESSEKPKLLEVFTPSEINDKALLAYFKHIS